MKTMVDQMILQRDSLSDVPASYTNGSNDQNIECTISKNLASSMSYLRINVSALQAYKVSL